MQQSHLCTLKSCQLLSWPGLQQRVESGAGIRNDLKNRIRTKSFRINNTGDHLLSAFQIFILIVPGNWYKSGSNHFLLLYYGT
jgi:hypothetical protein